MNGQLEKQLAEDGFYVSTTVGMSMYPMLRNRRDRVVLLPVDKHPLRKYELPLYRRPDGRYVLHRIIGVKNGYYLTRGDNTYCKEKVPFDWVVGYVSEFYRKGKHKNANQKSYRVYARVWNWMYPARSLYHFFRILPGRIKRKLFGKKQK